jgi:sugar O-acyltransferase (sialic acid O-acetyltransferase NeuD family)
MPLVKSQWSRLTEKINFMKNCVIIGAGGFGREVHMLIDQINVTSPQYKVLGFYDDSVAKGTFINGLEVLGTLQDLNEVNEPTGVCIAIGAPKVKKAIVEKLTNSLLFFPRLIHPSVIYGISENAIGKGTIITVNITIGEFVILNLGCTVGHDTVIGNYCAFMPQSNIAGEVVLGEAVYGGMGAGIINQVTVGNNVTLGAGSVVVKNIPSNCLAVGIPAKVIKEYEG